MLSAQTTDVNVNRVTATLFQKYRRPEDYLAVPQAELERDIFATGFYRQKAKALRGTMRLLIEEFDGEVPGAFRRSPAAAWGGAQDRERRLRRTRQSAGDRRRHARAPAFTAPRLHAAGGSGQDRTGSDPAGAACRLGALPAFADLARPPNLRRPAPSLRGLPPRRRSLPFESDLSQPLPDVREQLGGRRPEQDLTAEVEGACREHFRTTRMLVVRHLG